MSTTITIYNNAAAAAAARHPGERTIVTRFRSPARELAINISTAAWDAMAAAVSSPEYREILDGVLTSAVRAIVSRAYNNAYANSRVVINSIPAVLLSPDAILEEATGTSTEWLSKEQLEAAWRESATRAALYNAERYVSDRAYAKTFTRFEELILKLAGKTSSYTPEELDVMLARLADADLETQFGSFVVRRIESLKNRPAAAPVDFSAL